MKIRTNWKNRSEGGGGGSIIDMLNALSSHAKLNTPPISSSNLVQQPPSVVANSSLLSTAAAAVAASGKMNLSSAQNALGLNLNLNLSAANSDSSSNGGGSSSHSTSTNNINNNHSHNNNNNNNSSNNNGSNNNNNSNLLLNTSANLNNNQSNFQQQMANSQIDSIEANKGYTFEEQFKQLYELSDDPKRKEFLDDLFQFMADRNQPVNRIPIMAKQVLDLYELYNLVVARGGLVEVINKKIWREITKGLNLPSSITSAAFTLRTQYMKYLYPYECAKNNFSHQDELQQAIDGNRREGRRAGATSLGSYAAYLGASGVVNSDHQAGSGVGAYSASPSPNHLFTGAHNLLAQAQQQQLQHQHQQQNHHNHQHHQQQPQIPVPQQHQQLHLHQESRIEPQRPPSGSSSASPNAANFNQQRLYQDSIESDHDDEGSIDLGHSSKRNSPIDHEHQHLDPHNIHLNQQQTTDQQQQQMAAAAAAAAALRQQLGAAINFAGTQNFLGQLTNQTGAQANATQNPNSSPNVTNTNSASAINPSGDVSKQQQEQFLAALMATVNQQQQQQHQQHQQQQPQATPNSNTNTDQQAAARAALSMMASNAMLIGPSNTPDAMAVAAAAQAIGVKGAFIILLL